MGSGASRQVLITYLVLTGLSTFANALIWGINTLFLLDAGLSIAEAFAANAFFTVGLVLLEVPTGVVADGIGRRISYLLGCATLLVATLVYWLLWRAHGPFYLWAAASMLLGLGFTFFSGATEAWLVDALSHTKYEGALESVFGKGQVVGGAAMFFGSVTGGFVAQATNLGVPYLVRCAALGVALVVTLFLMKDLGFAPQPRASVAAALRSLVVQSVEHGFGNAPARWLMLAGPFTLGVGVFAFYALQPYLLELYGQSGSYGIAGAAAALVSLAQIFGGLLVPFLRRGFRHRTPFLAVGTGLAAGSLLVMGLVPSFWGVLALVALWATVFAATGPVRQAYLNGLIPSAQRATVLSSDSLVSSLGGAVFQPGLGKVAGVWGYPVSYVTGAMIQLFALPFLLLAFREKASSDLIAREGDAPEP